MRAFGAAGVADVERHHAKGEQVGQRAHPVAQVAVLEPRCAGIGAGIGARLDQLDAARVGDAGDRLEHQRLNPGEHGGVHADADAKRHDHDGGQARHPPDHPPGLAHVADHRLTPGPRTRATRCAL